MAHTYYTRLTMVSPSDAHTMDPRLGIVVAETATTGRFIIGNISWESAIAPNADTTTAFHTLGEMTIFEPLGMGLFDYLRLAAEDLGISNHLDARFLLEIEIIAEKMPTSGTPFKYIWPIMFIATEVKSTFTERGTEYNIKFVHTPYHAQLDMVQSRKDIINVEKVKTLKEYFDKLQFELEKREFEYAKANQKATVNLDPDKAMSALGAGVGNPAASDIFHDEYHFILDPALADWEFNTKGVRDLGGSGSAFNILRSQSLWDIPLRPGTTIIQQINKVIKSTKNASQLKSPNRPNAQSNAVTAQTIEDQLDRPYQFFRVETQSIYKGYDYIRGRYAVKHVFLIFLADQPNMYNYPIELDIINRTQNRKKINDRLIYYLQEKLLQKIYYYNYTGLNTDILKVDLNFNQSYALPSFSVVLPDRGILGPGAMGPTNSNPRVSPYDVTQESLATLRRDASELAAELSRRRRNTGGAPLTTDAAKRVESRLAELNTEIVRREKALLEQNRATAESNAANPINNRRDLLAGIKNFIEDITTGPERRKLESNSRMSSLRPRMEPDNILDQIENYNDSNQKLIEKIYSVLVSNRDLIELELEIIGDPFWLGSPNIFTVGSQNLTKVQFSILNNQRIQQEINARMPGIEGGSWNKKTIVWGEWGGAPQYKGAPLFYFLTQVPDGKLTENDQFNFNPNEQIVGIYMVRKVINSFKDGRWTQKLISVRDITIPSWVLPKTVSGELSFENFQAAVQSSETPRVAVKLARDREIEEIEKAAAQAGNPIRSQNPPGNTASVRMQTALKFREEALLGASDIPVVENPVEVAERLAQDGASRQAAYQLAKTRYQDQLTEYNAYMENANRQAFARAGISEQRPYSADTMTTIALTKSGAGGLDTWLASGTTANYARVGPEIYSNPMGVGYNSANNSYYKYENFQQGLQAGLDYYNFGQGVRPKGQESSERLIAPVDLPKSREDELKHISVKTGSNPAGRGGR